MLLSRKFYIDACFSFKINTNTHSKLMSLVILKMIPVTAGRVMKLFVKHLESVKMDWKRAIGMMTCQSQCSTPQIVHLNVKEKTNVSVCSLCNHAQDDDEEEEEDGGKDAVHKERGWQDACHVKPEGRTHSGGDLM